MIHPQEMVIAWVPTSKAWLEVWIKCLDCFCQLRLYRFKIQLMLLIQSWAIWVVQYGVQYGAQNIKNFVVRRFWLDVSISLFILFWFNQTPMILYVFFGPTNEIKGQFPPDINVKDAIAKLIAIWWYPLRMMIIDFSDYLRQKLVVQTVVLKDTKTLYKLLKTI